MILFQYTIVDHGDLVPSSNGILPLSRHHIPTRNHLKFSNIPQFQKVRKFKSAWLSFIGFLKWCKTINHLDYDVILRFVKGALKNVGYSFHNVQAPQQPHLSTIPKPLRVAVPTMSIARLASRSVLNLTASGKRISIPTRRRFANERQHENAPSWRENQKEKSLGPHLTHTTSTIANEIPSVGADKAPPELITSVDPDFVLTGSVPENTKRSTNGATNDAVAGRTSPELDVGEMEGAKFKIEPLRRTGEDGNTLRARLLCPFLLTSADARPKNHLS